MASRIVDEAAARPETTGPAPELTSFNLLDIPVDSSPFTISQARDSIERAGQEWQKSRLPTPAEWMAVRNHLAKAYAVSCALTGLQSLAREHHHARLVAEECGVAYIGITDYQVGCVEEGIDALAWAAVNALDAVRSVVATTEGA